MGLYVIVKGEKARRKGGGTAAARVAAATEAVSMLGAEAAASLGLNTIENQMSGKDSEADN